MKKYNKQNDKKLWNKAANGKVTCEQTIAFDRQRKQRIRTNTRNKGDNIN